MQSKFENSDFQNLTSYDQGMASMHLDRPQIILTAFSMFHGQFGTRTSPVNDASMKLILQGGLSYTFTSIDILFSIYFYVDTRISFF